MACYSTVKTTFRTLRDVIDAAAKLGMTAVYQGKTALKVTAKDKSLVFSQSDPKAPVTVNLDSAWNGERDLLPQLVRQYGENAVRATAAKTGFTATRDPQNPNQIVLTRYR